MTDKFAVSDTFLNARTRLVPRNAVAAIILDEEERLLLQLRDDKEEIFFPNHWGCFGGAIEPDESAMDALLRELHEELGIEFGKAAVETFITISFNMKPGMENTDRHFFLVRTARAAAKHLRLTEGRSAEWLAYEEVMKLPNVTPYDKFGLWLYFNQPRL